MAEFEFSPETVGLRNQFKARERLYASFREDEFSTVYICVRHHVSDIGPWTRFRDSGLESTYPTNQSRQERHRRLGHGSNRPAARLEQLQQSLHVGVRERAASVDVADRERLMRVSGLHIRSVPVSIQLQRTVVHPSKVE